MPEFDQLSRDENGRICLYEDDRWEEVLSLLKESVNDTQFNAWFLPMKPVLDGDNIIILFENSFSRNVVQRRFLITMESTVASVFNRHYNIKLIIPGEDPQLAPAPDPAKIERQKNLDSMLLPRYTFDTFVVGSSNRFAHAAATAVAEQPGMVYNPLFLYGGPGLGKTHLMQATGRGILDNKPDANVLYTTAEHFTNDVITAIQRGTTPQLREKMRTLDVLMIDDVQFIAGKEATESELFNTFNELYNNNKQIVFTSDRPPKEIEGLEVRLRSRFMQGLIVDIQIPDYETRVAILQRKANCDGIDVPDDVCHYIAANVKSNIRELEGALNRVTAWARLNGSRISLQLAQHALSYLPSDEKREYKPEDIVRNVASYYKLSEDDLYSVRRSADIAKARQLAMYIISEENQLSTTRVGDMFKRDHTTVMHAIKTIKAQLEKDDELQKVIDEILKK